MKLHTKIYYDFFGLTEADTPLCEVCGKVAVDIHHIYRRGMGGSKDKDVVRNLMALCRACHDEYGDKTDFRKKLIMIHDGNIADEITFEENEAYDRFYL